MNNFGTKAKTPEQIADTLVIAERPEVGKPKQLGKALHLSPSDFVSSHTGSEAIRKLIFTPERNIYSDEGFVFIPNDRIGLLAFVACKEGNIYAEGVAPADYINGFTGPKWLQFDQSVSDLDRFARRVRRAELDDPVLVGVVATALYGCLNNSEPDYLRRLFNNYSNRIIK